MSRVRLAAMWLALWFVQALAKGLPPIAELELVSWMLERARNEVDYYGRALRRADRFRETRA